MLNVEVNRTVVASVGPGAILGERSLLERGIRTATLRTVTRCRIAICSSSQVDQPDLVDVSREHRREAQASSDLHSA
jgi:CRP-like cAMP-binding protein